MKLAKDNASRAQRALDWGFNLAHDAAHQLALTSTVPPPARSITAEWGSHPEQSIPFQRVQNTSHGLENGLSALDIKGGNLA